MSRIKDIVMTVIILMLIMLVFTSELIHQNEIVEMSKEYQQKIENLADNPHIVIVEKEIINNIEHESIIEKIVEVEVPISEIITVSPIYKFDMDFHYEYTEFERSVFIQIVYREVGTQSDECQRAVASVILNRLRKGRWGNTLIDVITSQNQFAPCGGYKDQGKALTELFSKVPDSKGDYANYQRCANAVDYVMKNGNTIPYYVMYFQYQKHFDWPGYSEYKQIGSECFGYQDKDKLN